MVDTETVVRAKTDRAAFGSLYDRYQPLVTRYCMRRLFDRTVAEDVVSDVFLTVASNIRTFPGRTETDFRNRTVPRSAACAGSKTKFCW